MPGVPLHGPGGEPATGRAAGWGWWCVALAALVAAVARLPATGAPLRPDEAGYTLVARAWSPQPDSLFGTYWVDRPPVLIGVFRLSDSLMGPYGIRWLGVVAAGLAVLAAGAAAAEVVAHLHPEATRRESAVVVALTALAAAAFVTTPQIDILKTKGELLALPFLLGSVWLALRALRRRSAATAALAGLLAGAAPGLKQNLVGAVVFGVVLLAAHRLLGRTDTRTTVRLGSALLVGALLPAAGTVLWAAVAGVHPSAVYDAVYGVRAQALAVIADGPIGGIARRAATLVLAFLTTGLALTLVSLLVHVVRRRRTASSVAWAALAMALVDGVALALGGFYWLPYLFALVPSAVVGIAVLLSTGSAEARSTSEDGRPATRGRRLALALVAVVVGSWALSGAVWLWRLPSFDRAPVAVMLGRAIADVSEPGDSMTVVFGNANMQFEAGLPSPYEYLWSLPARARDPELEELAGVLRGPDAPTWLVTIYDVRAVQGDQAGDTLQAALAGRYEKVGRACGRRVVYRRVDQPRADPAITCAALKADYSNR